MNEEEIINRKNLGMCFALFYALAELPLKDQKDVPEALKSIRPLLEKVVVRGVGVAETQFCETLESLLLIRQNKLEETANKRAGLN